MKEKQTITYISEDGKEFISKKECEAHEKKLASMQLWSVTYSPDCCEGRGYHKRTYIRTEEAHQNGVMDFCYRKFGSMSAYVQGVRSGYIPSWSLTRLKSDHVMRGATFGLSEGGYDVIKLIWDAKSRELVIDEKFKES